MPTVKVNDITMYYEIHGTGEPIVLISGLASDHSLYQRMGLIPWLAEKYQVIAFDNRGVGHTDKPNIPYSIEMMADDTAALLHELGITRAHVLGTSMGGRVAVALALQHPQLVKSLVLISTAMKMTGSGPGWSLLQRRLMLLIPVLSGTLPYYAAIRQLKASRNFDCVDRLGEVQVPTLILHGKKDKSAPYPLAEAMHTGIKGSKMLTFQGGHLFFITKMQQCMEAIGDFLSQTR